MSAQSAVLEQSTPRALDLMQRLPTQDEQASAREAAVALARLYDKTGGVPLPKGTVKGETRRLEPAVAELVLDLLREIGSGHMVTFVPVGAQLTTTQAADILNVSRPFLTKLLKEGKIKFTPIGSHRRIKFEDIKAYKEERDALQHEVLDELLEIESG